MPRAPAMSFLGGRQAEQPLASPSRRHSLCAMAGWSFCPGGRPDPIQPWAFWLRSLVSLFPGGPALGPYPKEGTPPPLIPLLLGSPLD